jgi:acyl carrier protein
MVPSAIGIVEAVPRTASGKADRRVLPEPSHDRQGAARVPPRNECETAIGALWAELLDLSGALDVHTSFFDLGGHSLLATRLASRLRDRFGVDVPLRRLFEAPTIAALAQAVVDRANTPAAAGGPIRPTARRQRTRLREST